MLKNIPTYLWVLIVVIFILITASCWFISLQKFKVERLLAGEKEIMNRIINNAPSFDPTLNKVVNNSNIIPEWETYAHSTLGYTIEYPKNILPKTIVGDSLFDMYLYRNTPEENPKIFVSLSNSRTLSILERNKAFPSEVTKKTSISGIDAYIITDSEYPNSLSIELDKGGVFYSIRLGGLSSEIRDHIINSFHINFVPDLKNVNLISKSKEFTAIENMMSEWASYTNPALGFTIEYPKNILPLVKFDEVGGRVYFYKNTIQENPQLDITVRPAEGLSVHELTAGDRAPSTVQKITISGVDTYLLSFRELPNSPFVQFIKDDIFYSISFKELPLLVIDHIIDSFHIDFIVKDL